MDMKRLARTLLTVGGALWIGSGAGALAQSVETSKEWPTYGHDPGGMRFSPLTQITPANVGQLKVAWVYHMRPAGAVAPPGGGGRRTPAGETPDGAPGGRGRGRGGSGFRPSEVTPLVIDGIMYLSTPYSRVVAARADHRERNLGLPTPYRQLLRRAASNTGPATRRRRRRSSSVRATASCTR